MSRASRVAAGLRLVIGAGMVFGAAVLFPRIARAQSAEPLIVHSVSGQFVVTSGTQFSTLLHDPVLATNTGYIRLNPALLSVSAERFRDVVWDELGLKPNAPWSGKIFIALHPARSANDAVSVAVGPFLKSWSCSLEMPDVVSLPRYGRALSAALLLELASRSQTDFSHTPEIPAWLADGLAQLAFGRASDQIILSVPSRSVDGFAQNRLDKKELGIDAAAEARRILYNSPVLTFDQLCWPDASQINGLDGSAYLASAQVFTAELLGLPDGQEKMRNFLAILPRHLNWQTAFFQAYSQYFHRPLEVEKWWSLHAVRFTAHDPGPHWTVAVSRERLAALLSVPVEYRSNSNSLPVHMQVSLQSAVRSFTPSQREAVLLVRLRDLQMAQFRMAQPFAVLTSGYTAALADFLGEGKPYFPTAVNKHVVSVRRTATAAVTIRKLDQLDARRRAEEARVKIAAPTH